MNNLINSTKKQLAVLVDPDFVQNDYLETLINFANQNLIDFFLVGGSLISNKIENITIKLKTETNKKVVLFPGSLFQITDKADAILLLSLISGRNPEYLIGNHVIAAQFLKKSKLEIIPTGYILIESGKTTSVEYISNTKPIPADKIDIVISTAMAGEMLGLKMIYLEAGSGANTNIGTELIRKVKENITIPIIVGGGINSIKTFESVIDAGADIIVVGTAFEKNVQLITEFSKILQLKNIKNE